ncbi:MAG: sigma-54 dependent transcriptional regulator [Isosphaeraceae bacterium]
MSQMHLLIVHPDSSIRALLISMLQTLGHRLSEAPNDRVAVRMIETDPADLVLASTDPADPDAFEFLAYQRRKSPRTPVILIWEGCHPDRTREALQRGAASVLKFPLPATHVRAAVAQALGEPELPQTHVYNHARSAMTASRTVGDRSRVDVQPTRIDDQVQATPADCPALVGGDPALRQALELAETIAPTRTPVLIFGERGTGKSLLARTIHSRGPRRNAPLLQVSCASVRDGAIEVELFGRKGAFDEADQPGRIAQAHGGTLILKEVEDLPPALQFKLLRLVQYGEFEPVGSTQTTRVDVRLIATTSEELPSLVEQDRFRRDLYYRISVVGLHLPPLRDRKSDLDELADHFCARFAREIGREAIGFTSEALELMRAHDWPGNVLELEHEVERAVLQCRGSRIERDHLAIGQRPGTPSPSRMPTGPGILPLKEALEGPEKQLILQALEALEWNRQETARVLDINRTTLYKKMKKYGLLFNEPAWMN